MITDLLENDDTTMIKGSFFPSCTEVTEEHGCYINTDEILPFSNVFPHFYCKMYLVNYQVGQDK